MNERELEQIYNALRDLTAFVSDVMQDKKERALIIERLFDFSEDSKLRQERERRRAQLDRLLERASAEPTNSPADARNNVDLQENMKGIPKGIDEIFTKKEIEKMPKIKELQYRYVEKKNLHEFRYRRNGMEKSFSSTNFKIARQKALAFLKELTTNTNLLYQSKNEPFNRFAISYFETVKKYNVTEKTYTNEFNRLKNHILPACEKMSIRSITAPFIQKLLNDIRAQGYNRTAEGVYYIFKSVLDYAENTEVIKKSPIYAVRIPLHQRENGKALTLEDEKNFLSAIRGNKYELHFILLLYTGCRPCELLSLRFVKDGFITFQNCKQKNGKIVYKDTPITPMLAPYVNTIKNALPLCRNDSLTKNFNKLMPDYKMYDLRHTFASRCADCGVPEEVIDFWLGHSAKTLAGAVYRHYGEKYMHKMAKKVRY